VKKKNNPVITSNSVARIYAHSRLFGGGSSGGKGSALWVPWVIPSLHFSPSFTDNVLLRIFLKGFGLTGLPLSALTLVRIQGGGRAAVLQKSKRKSRNVNDLQKSTAGKAPYDELNYLEQAVLEGHQAAIRGVSNSVENTAEEVVVDQESENELGSVLPTSVNEFQAEANSTQLTPDLNSGKENKLMMIRRGRRLNLSGNVQLMPVSPFSLLSPLMESSSYVLEGLMKKAVIYEETRDRGTFVGSNSEYNIQKTNSSPLLLHFRHVGSKTRIMVPMMLENALASIIDVGNIQTRIVMANDKISKNTFGSVILPPRERTNSDHQLDPNSAHLFSSSDFDNESPSLLLDHSLSYSQSSSSDLESSITSDNSGSLGRPKDGNHNVKTIANSTFTASRQSSKEVGPSPKNYSAHRQFTRAVPKHNYSTSTIKSTSSLFLPSSSIAALLQSVYDIQRALTNLNMYHSIPRSQRNTSRITSALQGRQTFDSQRGDFAESPSEFFGKDPSNQSGENNNNPALDLLLSEDLRRSATKESINENDDIGYGTRALDIGGSANDDSAFHSRDDYVGEYKEESRHDSFSEGPSGKSITTYDHGSLFRNLASSLPNVLYPMNSLSLVSQVTNLGPVQGTMTRIAAMNISTWKSLLLLPLSLGHNPGINGSKGTLDYTHTHASLISSQANSPYRHDLDGHEFQKSKDQVMEQYKPEQLSPHGVQFLDTDNNKQRGYDIRQSKERVTGGDISTSTHIQSAESVLTNNNNDDAPSAASILPSDIIPPKVSPVYYFTATSPLKHFLYNSKHFANTYNLVLATNRLKPNMQSTLMTSTIYDRPLNTSGRHSTSDTISEAHASTKLYHISHHNNSLIVTEETSFDPTESAPSTREASRSVNAPLAYARSIHAIGNNHIHSEIPVLRLPRSKISAAAMLSNPTLLALSSATPAKLKKYLQTKKIQRGIIKNNQSGNNFANQVNQPSSFSDDYFGDVVSGQGNATNEPMPANEQFVVSDDFHLEDEEEDENEERELRKLRKRIEKIISDELRRYGFQL
jgi:hypothetical protein